MRKPRPLRKAKLDLKAARRDGLFEAYREPDEDTSMRYVEGWDEIAFYGRDADGQGGQVMIKLEHLDKVMTFLAVVKQHVLTTEHQSAVALIRFYLRDAWERGMKVKEADKDLLSAEDYAAFTKALRCCEEQRESLSFAEANFVAEMTNNHAKRGDKVICLEGQLERLRRISGKAYVE